MAYVKVFHTLTRWWMIDETWQTWILISLSFFLSFFAKKHNFWVTFICLAAHSYCAHFVYFLLLVRSMKLYCACNIFNANTKTRAFFFLLSHLVRLNGSAGMEIMHACHTYLSRQYLNPCADPLNRFCNVNWNYN